MKTDRKYDFSTLMKIREVNDHQRRWVTSTHLYFADHKGSYIRLAYADCGLLRALAARHPRPG